MNRGFTNIAIIIGLVVIVAGAGWWYLNTSNAPATAISPQTTQENGDVETSANQPTNFNTGTQTSPKPTPATNVPKQQPVETTQQTSSGAIAPTCTITADKSVYKSEEPMTFSWTTRNASFANLQLITAAEDMEDWLTHLGSDLPLSGASGTKMRAVRSKGEVTVSLEIYSYAAEGMKTGSCSTVVLVQ